jgi:hypothetical protein
MPSATRAGGEIAVNQVTEGTQSGPSAVALSDGHYAIAGTNGDLTVSARILAADGTPIGADIAITATQAFKSLVIALAGGGWRRQLQRPRQCARQSDDQRHRRGERAERRRRQRHLCRLRRRRHDRRDGGGGTDTVETVLSPYFVRAANVENLTYTGSGAFTGGGNALDNLITGGGGTRRRRCLPVQRSGRRRRRDRRLRLGQRPDLPERR